MDNGSMIAIVSSALALTASFTALLLAKRAAASFDRAFAKVKTPSLEVEPPTAAAKVFGNIVFREPAGRAFGQAEDDLKITLAVERTKP